MNMVNSIIIEGVVENISMTEKINGFMHGRLELSSERFYRTGDDTKKESCSFNVEVFGQLAVYCTKYTKKGKRVRIVGRLKQNRWEDAKGKKHSELVVVAEHIESLKEVKDE